MSDCCERYPDFIVICSFLEIFGANLAPDKENQMPQPYKLKTWLEMDSAGRGHRVKVNSIYQFLLGLLSSFSIHREKCTNIIDVPKYLIAFTESQNMTYESDLLRNWGFYDITIKDKLAIIRRLLDYQLDNNKRLTELCGMKKGPEIRHEPLGRDCRGNYYWKFGEGRSCYVIKELIDPKSETFCGFINNQHAAHELINHIKKFRLSNLKSITRSEVKITTMLLRCGMCKKYYDGSQVKDAAIHFDNEDWYCPNCDQKQLISTLTDFFLPEE